MSFASLPHCQIDEIFACLGPDFFHIRLSCLLARERSNSMDLALEILRWHCVNSALLDEKLRCIEILGRLPLRCSICDGRAKTRQMYRYTLRLDGHREGLLYLCCYCVLQEARSFLTHRGGTSGLISKGGGDRRDQATLLVAILSRMRMPCGGFASECLASMRPAIRQ